MFASFVQDLIEQGRSANTIRAYSLDWQHFARWYEQVNHESLALDRLTALDVQDYVNWSKREGYKPGTINRRLGLIKHVIAWAEDRELVSTELRRRVKRIGIVKKQKLGPKSLEPVAIRKLLRELERTGTARDRAIVYLLLYTGLRVGELVKLRPADVELTSRKGTVTVAATNAKGGKERVVPIPTMARQMLQAYLDEQNDESHQKQEALLFTGRQGPISAAGVAAMLRKHASRAGVGSLTPHMLRHTFAYMYLRNNGNDLVALADILGHSNLNTTQIYTKRRLEDLQQGVENVRFV